MDPLTEADCELSQALHHLNRGAAAMAGTHPPDQWAAGEFQVLALRIERLRRRIVKGNGARQGRAVAA